MKPEFRRIHFVGSGISRDHKYCKVDMIPTDNVYPSAKSPPPTASIVTMTLRMSAQAANATKKPKSTQTVRSMERSRFLIIA